MGIIFFPLFDMANLSVWPWVVCIEPDYFITTVVLCNFPQFVILENKHLSVLNLALLGVNLKC